MPERLKVGVNAPQGGQHNVAALAMLERPIACGSCGREWLRGWFSHSDLGGTGYFYHNGCIEGLFKDALSGARVFGVDDHAADETL